MKMWMASSTSFGLGLLTCMMIIWCTSPVDSQGQRAITCCQSVSKALIRSTVVECYEQVEQSNADYCSIHAYILVTTSGDKWCVDPSVKWLKHKLKILKKSGVSCHPLVHDE